MEAHDEHIDGEIAYQLHGNCYINLTNHCTLRCAFCPKFNKQWQVQGYPLRLKKDPTIDQILEAVGDVSQYKEIVFCGLGEPTLKLGVLLRVASALKKQGAYIRLNTDGLGNLVQGMDITPKLAGKIDALSISVNAQNEEIYNQHCRPPQFGTYPAIFDFIEAAIPHIKDITLTAIDGLKGVDINACAAIADYYKVKFRRRELDKVG